MIIPWGWSVFGALLLLFPADRLLSSVVRLRSMDSFQSLENSPRHRPWWWVPILWVDPLRGYVGTYLMTAAVAGSDEWITTDKRLYALAMLVLASGVLAQMFTRRGDEAWLAPIGFVAGVVAVLTPWPVALIAGAMAFTAMFGFRSISAFFLVGFSMVAALALPLDANPVWFVPALGVLALPFLVAVLSGRTMEIPTRESSARQTVAS